MIKKLNIMKIIKVAAGSSIAILLANILGLQNSLSAGIITLLSIQDTKKETLLIAIKRLIAFFLAVGIAYILFENLGYKPLVFGLFLLFFVSLSYLFYLQDGISMCAVLTTHFLIEKSMNLSFIGNEFLLMLIGTLIGILLNMFMPNKIEIIKDDIQLIEKDMKSILSLMALCIIGNGGKNHCSSECKEDCSLQNLLQSLDKHLHRGVNHAYENINNTLLMDTRYYLRYFVMRRNQYEILQRISEQIGFLTTFPKQAEPISEFINEITTHFHENNDVRYLLERSTEIIERFKEEENPITREEFENRAILFMIMKDIENLLKVKRNFIKINKEI